MNKCIFTGNLTKDPELNETSKGASVCKFSIAVTRDYANADGTKESDFLNIVAWRGLGENCAKFLKKGNKVLVCGKLETRSYEDKDGIKRNVFEIIASDVEFLTPKQQGETVTRERPTLTPIDDNQLPF
jgi:single-strand DNA-binding protein